VNTNFFVFFTGRGGLEMIVFVNKKEGGEGKRREEEKKKRSKEKKTEVTYPNSCSPEPS
jgi:hypothetical protein